MFLTATNTVIVNECGIHLLLILITIETNTSLGMPTEDHTEEPCIADPKSRGMAERSHCPIFFNLLCQHEQLAYRIRLQIVQLSNFTACASSMAAFYLFSLNAGGFSNILVYGLAQMEEVGGLRGWQ